MVDSARTGGKSAVSDREATSTGRLAATVARDLVFPRHSSGFPAWIARSAREHLPLVLLTGVYIGAGVALQAVTGLDLTRELGWISIVYGAYFGIFFVAICAGALLSVYLASRTVGSLARSAGRPSPFSSRWADYRRHLAPERLAGIFTVFFLYVPFMNMFVGFKGTIPAIQPFAWDVPFMVLDRALHLGHHPWALLQPLFGSAPATAALDLLYYAWFPIKMLFLIWMAWSPRRDLRGQFLLAFWGLWILLGTAMAMAFSSAGPCYYGLVVGGPDPYAPLMEYLRRVDATHPLTALDVQALLWSGYTGATHLVEGISAMPSLHVAIPVLCAIAGWKIDRRLGVVFAAYVLVILVGSVHLAWHYAIDGYVVLALVPLMWWACGKGWRAYNRWTEGRA
jgi:hypothetical protein